MQLPIDFERIMAQQLGESTAKSLCHALSCTTSPTSIRINKRKLCTDSEYYNSESMEGKPQYTGDGQALTSNVENTIDGAFKSKFEKFKWAENDNIESAVPWCKEGLYLKTRPAFTFDPLFHAGCYYVQEASSMYVSQILKSYLPETPVIALDMCAAPGGKSTLTISNLPEGSLLVANEVMRQRAQVLSENITKWGASNTIVTSNYAEDFASLGETFDLIICDAPCSGEGMFRKDENAINDWSLENVEICWRRQRDILQNLWDCLKPGGLLIYSTCTFNSLEDEENVDWIVNELGGILLPLNDNPEWEIKNGHFFPHLIKGEGFFIAPIRKENKNEDSDSQSNSKKKKKKDNTQKPSPIPKEIKNWILRAEDFAFFTQNDVFTALPKEHFEFYSRIINVLKVISAGVEIATLKGKQLQPCHSLAMSEELNPSSFPCIELTLEQAIAYLRTEAIQVEAPKGYILLTYKNHPIGFGKNIGNRVNNLYPSEWRIRSSYAH